MPLSAMRLAKPRRIMSSREPVQSAAPRCRRVAIPRPTQVSRQTQDAGAKVIRAGTGRGGVITHCPHHYCLRQSGGLDKYDGQHSPRHLGPRASDHWTWSCRQPGSGNGGWHGVWGPAETNRVGMSGGTAILVRNVSRSSEAQRCTGPQWRWCVGQGAGPTSYPPTGRRTPTRARTQKRHRL